MHQRNGNYCRNSNAFGLNFKVAETPRRLQNRVCHISALFRNLRVSGFIEAIKHLQTFTGMVTKLFIAFHFHPNPNAVLALKCTHMKSHREPARRLHLKKQSSTFIAN